jgi:hypothetical protein
MSQLDLATTDPKDHLILERQIRDRSADTCDSLQAIGLAAQGPDGAFVRVLPPGHDLARVMVGQDRHVEPPGAEDAVRVMVEQRDIPRPAVGAHLSRPFSAILDAQRAIDEQNLSVRGDRPHMDAGVPAFHEDTRSYLTHRGFTILGPEM